MKNRKKLVLIGPLPITGDAIGGAKVNFLGIVKRFRESAVFDIKVINTSRTLFGKVGIRRFFENLKTYVFVITKLIAKIDCIDIVLLAINPHAAHFVAPPIWLFCKQKKRPFSILFFGGDFDDYYLNLSLVNKLLAKKTYFKSDLILMQTKRLCSLFENQENIKWFPNTRNIDTIKINKKRKVGKLVFISKLRKDKGYIEAMEAVKKLPSEIHLDIYGSLTLETNLNEIENYPRCNYLGEIEPEKVADILRSAYVLLLPTYYAGEGYPGIIIESLQCGTPVITTHWRDIPEIIQNNENGILINPHSVKDIVTAVINLKNNSHLYRKISDGALKKGEFFKSDKWHNQLEQQLLTLFR
jgi:glycosyltransferase involved in cell wall biosynthesis